MNKIIKILILLILPQLLFAQEDEIDNTVKKAVTKFKTAIKNKDYDELISVTYFPIKRQYPIPDIYASDFENRFEELIDNKIRQLILNSTMDDWSLMGWEGIMLDRGQIWIGAERGGIVAINEEIQDLEKVKAKYIKIDREKLHPSLRNYSEPVLHIKTKSFRVRIDKMPNDTYRYTSWDHYEPFDNLPDLTLYCNKTETDGPFTIYKFKNKGYSYIIYDAWRNLGPELTGTVFLSLMKNDESILNHNAAKLDVYGVIGTDQEWIGQQVIGSEVQGILPQTVNHFLKDLIQKKDLSSYFSDDWIFSYSDYNRATGTTEGQGFPYKATDADNTITLRVKENGNGWEPTGKIKIYDLKFNLREEILRYNVPEFTIQSQDWKSLPTRVFFDARSLDFYFNDKGKIVKLKYTSEDPG